MENNNPMAKTSIIQLNGVDGDSICLYAYDPKEMSEAQAINSIESAMEAAFQQDEAGFVEDGDILSVADETLENLGIDRVQFGNASTNRL